MRRELDRTGSLGTPAQWDHKGLKYLLLWDPEPEQMTSSHTQHGIPFRCIVLPFVQNVSFQCIWPQTEHKASSKTFSFSITNVQPKACLYLVIFTKGDLC